ncbi:hydroxyacid dehydrogenase [bacterium]|nr:hydroxyacid dehydrogenase [bacterium]|tara:strand:+ start:2634 stop:3605 length:972 start_codon:yes stop_codon:yes gene_type:complete
MENKKLKILNTMGDNFADKAKNIIEELGDVDHKLVGQDDFLEIIDAYDVVIVGLVPVVNKEILDKAKKLKYIAIPANTLENIDVDYAESKGVEVVSLWGETEFLNTITGTAELACGLMIDIVRFNPWAFDSVKNNEWSKNREKFRGRNLYGKTLGIVGMGRLGTWMARYGKAFGMNVVFYSPNTEKGPTADCRKVSFEELLKESDIISLHAHLNKETEHMFDADAFSKMKKEAYLVNTARGKIVDESALLDALEKKEIAGYAADVLADEFELGPTFGDYPLVEYSKSHMNVIIVPHTGGMTHESRENTDIFVAEKLRKIISSK